MTEAHTNVTQPKASPSAETASAARAQRGNSGLVDGQVERRNASRAAVDLFVQERDGERLFVHPATNLSATGIFVESHSYSLRNALERKYIDLEFALPDEDAFIAVRGEVIGARRIRGFAHGLAIRFLNLQPADRVRIEAFVIRKLAEGAGEGPISEAAPT